MRVPTQSPPLQPGNIALSDSETAEALTNSLEAQFQSKTISSVPAVTEIVNVGLMSFFLTLVSEPKITNPDEVHEAITALKFARDASPNGIPNRAMNLLPQ
jgi:hypothetical protein